MRGLTPDERAELKRHVNSVGRRASYGDYLASIATVTELVRQRRIAVLADTADHLETEITDLGRLALRVCPPAPVGTS